MNLIKNKQDENRALDIMEKAFIGSTGMTWMLKRNSKANLRIFLSFFFHEVSVKNGAWLTSDRNGVVFFLPIAKPSAIDTEYFQKTICICMYNGFYQRDKSDAV